ncbi:hypothetical protein I4U23_006666 [Adineta vaga]|nr:hypothetical protein I4U23_006666 [Adineta vaga]
MSSSDIPSLWLTPEKCPNQWIFRCLTSLDNLVETNLAAHYFRQLVTILEDDYHILNYHLEIGHNLTKNNQFDVCIFFNDPRRSNNPSTTRVCISCEPTHELCSASFLSEQRHTRAWLDARAREKLILTPIRHVERLSELIDENEEMEAFWRDAVELIHRECDQLNGFYPKLTLNHGTYRNHAHLHLKMTFNDQIWHDTIAPRHAEQLQQMKQILKNPNIMEDCFGHQKDKKKKEDSTET